MAERAVKADPALVEASFNRACALERLSLRDEARRAWQDYLKVDGSSGWAAEARDRLKVLGESPQSKSQDEERREIELASSGLPNPGDLRIDQELARGGATLAQHEVGGGVAAARVERPHFRGACADGSPRARREHASARTRRRLLAGRRRGHDQGTGCQRCCGAGGRAPDVQRSGRCLRRRPHRRLEAVGSAGDRAARAGREPAGVGGPPLSRHRSLLRQ